MSIKQPLAHLLVSVTKKYLSIFSQQTEGVGIDRYQYVLVLINLHDEKLTQKALSELLEVDKSYMVNIIDYLADKGYVVRETNLKDRRQHLIKLTEKARAVVPEIEQVIAGLNKKSMENLSEGQIEIFSEVLVQINSNLSGGIPSEIIINYKK
ncbi:MarR family transcriptional regulator [Pedobacter sp. P351]|uniref:MarR family winged helix-turn-helix transcriptional regulator n=1 Tax=Pedobacter superstes TaxID=3133441 RepID=UPI00309A18DA